MGTSTQSLTAAGWRPVEPEFRASRLVEWNGRYALMRELTDRYRESVVARMRATARAAGLDPAYPAMHAHNAMCGLHACRPWREVDYSLVRKVLWLDRDVQWRASDVLNRWVERTWPAVVAAMREAQS